MRLLTILSLVAYVTGASCQDDVDVLSLFMSALHSSGGHETLALVVKDLTEQKEERIAKIIKNVSGKR